MRIAVDKESLDAVRPDGNDYIYLFDDELLEDLAETGLHCIRHDQCNYVDINLTRFNVDCMKKAKKTDDFRNIKKENYKFAIIVPNYNNEHGDYKGKTYLRNCIESILNQSYNALTLILVDDCSTDASVDAIKEYQKQDDRVILIQNKRKRYNGGSRNIGIDYALDHLDFDYFIFLDSDDWWKHDKVLELINSRLYNHELLTLGCEMVGKNGVFAKNLNDVKCYEDLYSLNGRLWCTAWARVIRKDKIVYFMEDTLMEDRVWTYRLADGLNFSNVTNLKEIVYCWNRMNTSNSVSLVRDDYWNACAYCHIGHQLQLISQMKHKEMIPKIKERINECIRKASNGQYQQY